MRNCYKLLTIVLLLGMAKAALAQDVIVKNDNSTVLSKVVEVTSTEVKYKKWSNQEGPTYALPISEIARVNYENGDVDYFSKTNDNQQQQNNYPQQQNTYQQPKTYPQLPYGTGRLYMEAAAGVMRLNGQTLRDEEVRRLVTAQEYQAYISGKNLYGTGIVFLTLGTISLTVCSVALSLGNYSKYEKVTVTSAVAGLALGGLGIAFMIPGSNKLNGVAKNFNQRQGAFPRISLAPTLMPLEMPQMQNSHALGLSLSMNF